MALSKQSDREVMSLILLKEQSNAIRTIAKALSTPHKSVGISDVGREIVALGLREYFSPANIAIGTSVADSDVEAA